MASAQHPPSPLVEPGTIVREAPPPAVGSCIGGSCLTRPTGGVLTPGASARPIRFGRAAAIIGLVSAGISLGGAIAIAAADDFDSEVVTRSVWLGYTAVMPPFVAFGAYRARRHRRVAGTRSARRLGWVAYTAAVSQGVLQLTLTAQGTKIPAGLTIASGLFGALALAPHAFDAWVGVRGARLRGRAFIRPTLTGLHVQF
jgi:hypothetical protein